MYQASPLIQNFFSSQLFLALMMSIAFMPILKRIGVNLKLVDHPGGRKQHESSVPLVGGPAIFLACAISLYVWGVPNEFYGMAVAVTGLFILGLLDDRFDVSAKIRLFSQTILIASALYWDNNWISSIQISESYTLQFSWFQYPLTIIYILGLTNAINMLDGLDGLSSGISLIILGFIISISSIALASDITLISLCLFGAVLGFWAYNYRFSWRKKASVFMGDSGTMLLGFLLPFLAIKLSNVAPSEAPKSILLWLFAIPIWDICAVVIKRIREKKSPLQAGREHVHHVLMRAGLSVRQSLHLIYLLTISAISFGISLKYFNTSLLESFSIYLIFMVIYLGRVGSLTQKPNTQVYDFNRFGERREPILLDDDVVVDIERKRTNTIS